MKIPLPILIMCKKIAKKYYDEAYVVGDSSSDYDISKSFGGDNLRISIVTALLVGVILLFTFQNAALPFILGTYHTGKYLDKLQFAVYDG